MERQGLFGEALSIAQEYLKQYPDDQAMKKECRFLKTRNEVAKGNEAVQSQTSDAGTSQTTGSDDTGDNTAAGTGADNDNVSTSATRATATKAPQSQTSTMGTTGSTAHLKVQQIQDVPVQARQRHQRHETAGRNNVDGDTGRYRLLLY